MGRKILGFVSLLVLMIVRWRCIQMTSIADHGPGQIDAHSISSVQSRVQLALEVEGIKEHGSTISGAGLKQFRALLNGGENSPRECLYSLLQFLCTLGIYLFGVYIYDGEHFKTFCDGILDKINIITAKTYPNLNKQLLSTKDLFSSLFSHWFNREAFRDQEVPTYCLRCDELKRLASLIDFRFTSPVPLVILSKSGFYYCKDRQCIECCDCAKRVNLSDLDPDSDPSASCFHASPNCGFGKSISESPSRELPSDQQAEGPADAPDNQESPADTDDSEEKEEPSQIRGGQQNDATGESNGRLPTASKDQSTTKPPDISSQDKFQAVPNDEKGRIIPQRMEGREDELKASQLVKEPVSNLHTGTICLEKSYVSATSDAEKSPEVASLTAYGATQNEGGGARPKTRSAPQGSGARSKTQSPPQVSAGGGATPMTQSTPQFCASEGNASKQGPMPERQVNGKLHYWADLAKFASESFSAHSQTKPHSEAIWSSPCEKTDVHDSFYSTSRLELSQFPDNLQSKEFFHFVCSAANLTVKLNIRYTSDARPDNDPYKKNHSSARYGTGFASLESEADMAGAQIKAIKECPSKSKVKKMKQLLSRTTRTTSKEYFSVQTNRHVVFDDFEASHTEVIFEILEAGTHHIKRYKAKGSRVINDIEEGIYSTVLLCKTSESELMCTLREERGRFVSLRESLSMQTKKQFMDTCVVISYPHGHDKMVTFGNTTILKYILHNQGPPSERKQLERYIKNNTELTRQDIRETLMYTAGTCNGSSGAPVFTCQIMRQALGMEMELKVALWIHNGVERESGLSCSVMRKYGPELTKHTQETAEVMPKLNSTGDHSNTISSMSSQLTTSTSFEMPMLTQGLAETRYVTVTSRLETFTSDYVSRCKHSQLELAAAGFYFAGYRDCIKCFSCALGLKGWTEDIDVYKEHKRHKPDCRFLKAHMDSSNEIDPDLLYHEFGGKDGNIKVDLLKVERKKLKESLACHVCWKHPATELFLPCGHVLVCERCSSFLYSCPTCYKDVYATVTLYMS